MLTAVRALLCALLLAQGKVPPSAPPPSAKPVAAASTKGQQLEALATQERNLARITGTDLKGNIDAVTHAFTAWGVALGSQGDALDVLFGTSQQTGASVGPLAGTLYHFAPTLKQFGLSFGQSAAFVGLLTKNGIEADGILTSLQTSLGRFAEKGVDGPHAFVLMMDAFKNAATDSDAIDLADRIFGRVQGKQLAVAVRQGKLDMQELTDRVRALAQTINGTASVTDTLNVSQALLRQGATEAEPSQLQPPKKIESRPTAEDRIASYTLLLTVFTGLLAAVAIYQGFQLQKTVAAMGRQEKLTSESVAEMHRTAEATFDAADAARLSAAIARDSLNHLEREFLATHRPRLQIRNVVVCVPDPEPMEGSESKNPNMRVFALFAPQHLVRGRLIVVNVGDTAATITDSGCWVDWGAYPLPMEPKYTGKVGTQCVPMGLLEPGESAAGWFESEKVMGDDEGGLLMVGEARMFLWVMGWIAYTDGRGTPRRTGFCRSYRKPRGSHDGNFVAVENPDYEYAD